MFSVFEWFAYTPWTSCEFSLTMGENQSSLGTKNSRSAPGSKCSTPMEISIQGCSTSRDDQLDQGIICVTPTGDGDRGSVSGEDQDPVGLEVDYEQDEVWPAYVQYLHLTCYNMGLLTLSHIQQICNRLLCIYLGKSMENLYIWKYNYCIGLKTMWQKEKVLILRSSWAISPLATMFPKVVCCRIIRKRLYVGKGKTVLCLFIIYTGL